MAKHRATEAELEKALDVEDFWLLKVDDEAWVQEHLAAVLAACEDPELPEATRLRAILESLRVLSASRNGMYSLAACPWRWKFFTAFTDAFEASRDRLAAFAETRDIDPTPILGLQIAERQKWGEVDTLLRRLQLIECGPLAGQLNDKAAALRLRMDQRADERSRNVKPQPAEIPTTLAAKTPAASGYRPAAWFPSEVRSKLRMAARKSRKTKRVASRTIDGVKHYSEDDARRHWAELFPVPWPVPPQPRTPKPTRRNEV